VHRDDRHYIFIEELLYESNKGHIAVIEINDSGEPSTPQTVLECDYHLSYPFVFDHDGETWMIPESSENQTVSLYRCRKFPDQWEFVMHLFEGQSLVDCTLHFHDGLWWLFANTAAHSSLAKHDELHLFYATDFRSTGWTAHPLNPIVSDAKNARPAGKLFYHQGRLVRPAQNCSYHYGYGYNLNVIHTLNKTQYAESNLRAVIPNWDRSVVATHTYNASPGLSVIDAMVVRPR